MKKVIVILLSLSSLHGEPRDPMRCNNCKKQEKKDKELQVAALNVLSTAVNGAFVIAANPDDKNNKLQFGQTLANSFIGLIAAAMKSTSLDIYDAFGNKIASEKIAQVVGARLLQAHLEECAPTFIRYMRK